MASVAAIAVAVPWAYAGERRRPMSTLPVIEVWKAKHEMWLKQDGRISRRFRIYLGRQIEATKEHQGDGRTPVGKYYVAEKRAKSSFRRFLGISYPNIDDAERAFAERLITADQWADILFANLRGQVPPWQTPLGGRVGIHGHGGRDDFGFDWTKGCIAVSDDDIDYLYARVPVGAPVIIHD
ncbi:MAG: L,D-transpeptidase [Deltaproteobacteria bacterium]|nr:L,D-transpeptidase [Deltaproteobacteria bacterium]